MVKPDNNLFDFVGVEMSKYGNIEDFLNDPAFVAWVQRGEGDSLWKDYVHTHPDQENLFNDAIFIVLSMNDKKQELKKEEIDQIWQKLDAAYVVDASRIVRKKVIWYSIAGVFMLAVLLSSLYYSQYQSDFSAYLGQFNFVKQTYGAHLILGDGSVVDLGDHSSVSYSQTENELLIDSVPYVRPVSDVNTATPFSGKLNQMIVPNGKRSMVCLADGSKVWLNSGSRLVYPDSFDEVNKRELALQGEAFFEVQKDEQKPFVVHTDGMKIFVTGTRFNVKAYAGDQAIETVLAEGSVEVTKSGFDLLGLTRNTLKPNQKAVFDRSLNDISLAEANVPHVTSWVNGFLIFESEPLESVLQCIARYYDVKFVLDDEAVSRYTISGKLDLKDSISTILRIIADIAPVSYSQTESEIHFQGKNS